MPWTPDSDSRLQGWFKADALNLANNDPVAPWTGSEQSRNLTAGGAPTFKTNIQNGLPGVLYDGIDDYHDGSYAASVPQPRTVIILAKSTTWQKTITDSAGGARNLVSSTFSVFHLLRIHAGAGVLDSTVGLSTTDLVIIGAVFNGASSLGYINGVQRIAGDAGSQSLASGPRFGANITPGEFFSGYLFEILDYAGALSELDLAVVGIYLADKWGLTWSGAQLPPTKGWTAPPRSTVWTPEARPTVWTAQGSTT